MVQENLRPRPRAAMWRRLLDSATREIMPIATFDPAGVAF